MTKTNKQLKQEYNQLCYRLNASALMASNNKSLVFTETCRVDTAQVLYEATSAQVTTIYTEIKARGMRVKRQH